MHYIFRWEGKEWERRRRVSSHHFLTRRKVVRMAVPRMTAARTQIMVRVPELIEDRSPCLEMGSS